RAATRATDWRWMGLGSARPEAPRSHRAYGVSCRARAKTCATPLLGGDSPPEPLTLGSIGSPVPRRTGRRGLGYGGGGLYTPPPGDVVTVARDLETRRQGRSTASRSSARSSARRRSAKSRSEITGVKRS